VTAWGGDAAALKVLRIASAVNAQPATWMDLAACAQVGGDLWFPERGEPAGPAKRVCMTCPVRASCLEYALVHHENHGVWGGLSEHERRDRMRQRRGRAA
jgi:WhiB family transcriptional regulator, redox-sensing transcriptional regulator